MNLYDSLLERLGGRQYSNYFSCLCPYHDDNSPSMLVYEESDNPKYAFQCRSCNAHGSLDKLNKKIGAHYTPKITQCQTNVLPRWRKWGDSLEDVSITSHESLKRVTQFQTYFRKRKIEGFIEKGKFGYRDGWCVFPVMDIQSRVMDVVVRSTQSNNGTRYFLLGDHLSDSGSLYSPDWHRVQEASVIYCVFGMIDTWSLEALGLPCVTGIAGKNVPLDSLQALGKRIIFLPDDGEEREAHSFANKLGWKARVKELKFPDNTKDVDDVRVQYGNEVLRELIGI